MIRRLWECEDAGRITRLWVGLRPQETRGPPIFEDPARELSFGSTRC